MLRAVHARRDVDERPFKRQLPGFDPAIDAALGLLAVEQRAVIALHYAGDLPIAAVADALREPAGTAKSRLAAALERLRRDLGELT